MGEVVGGKAVRLQNDIVVQEIVSEGDAAPYDVLHEGLAIDRHLEADYRSGGPGRRRSPVAAAAVVARAFALAL